MNRKLYFSTVLISTLSISSVHAINNSIEELVLSFDEIKCGSNNIDSKPSVAKKFTMLLSGPKKYFGIPVIPHDYKKGGESIRPLFRGFDTMQVTFNYYVIDASYGRKFQFVGYDRFIYLGSESDIDSGLKRYKKIESDLVSRLGEPLNVLELMTHDLMSKYGKHVSKWWRYRQKTKGDTLFIGLNDGVYQKDRYAVVSSICDLEWRSSKTSENLLDFTKQKGNLFK